MATKIGATPQVEELEINPSGPSTLTPGQPSEQLEVDEATNDQAEPVYPTGVALWGPVISLMICVVFIGLDMTIVAVTIPTLTNQFKTVNDIGWYSSVFGLISSSFVFFFSKAYTVFDVKRCFLFAIALFQLGSLLCTIAPVSAVFILGRAVAGFGGAGLNMGGITILTHSFPTQKRPLWYAIFAAVQTVAMVTAPLIGGVLIDAFTWRACFGINLPFGVLCLFVTAYYFKNPVVNADANLPLKEKVKRMDLLGSALFVPGIVCLLIGLQWGGTRYGWSNARIIVLLVLFGVLISIFGFMQYRRQDAATLPPRILKQRSVIAGAVFSACCSGILGVTEYYIALYFQGVRGFTPTKSGALGLPMIVGLSIGVLSSGTLTTMVGYYHPFMLATSLIAPIITGLLSTLDLDSDLVKPLTLLGALGVTMGLGMQGPVSAISSVLQPKDIPLGIAINGFGGGIGSALFLSAAAALFQNRLVEEISKTASSSKTTTIINNNNPNLTNLTTILNGTVTGVIQGVTNLTFTNTTTTANTNNRINLTNILEHGGAGLADLRTHLGQDALKAVLMGYDKAVTQTFYIPVALAVLSLAACFGVEWRSVKVKTG